jgi:hypothetical protein
MGVGPVMREERRPEWRRVSLRERQWPGPEDGAPAEWGPEVRPLRVGAAGVPRGGQLPEETPERLPAPALEGRPLAKLPAPPAEALPAAAAAVGAEPPAGQPGAMCHRNRKTCCRSEASYGISGIPVGGAVEHSAQRREELLPGEVSRNGRRWPPWRGSRSRTPRRGYSAQFLRSLYRQTYSGLQVRQASVASRKG